MKKFSYNLTRIGQKLPLFCLITMLTIALGLSKSYAQFSTVANSPATFIDGGESPSVASFTYAPVGGPWSFASGGGLSKNNSGFTNGSPNAPQGNQIIFLQGVGRASRTIQVTQSGFYRLRFKAALRANMPNQTQNVGIKIDGINIGEIPVPNTNYTDLYSLAIYLNTGNHALELRGTRPIAGDHTAFVDALYLAPVHDWHNPQTWGGALPGTNSTVTITAGTAVAAHSNINVKRITVNGQLLGVQNRNVNIATHNIMVMGSNALLEFGQALAPYPMNATITLTATPNDGATAHPAMGNNFLGVMGGRLELHGLVKNSWTKLQDDLGNRHIRLAEATNWQAGDEIVVVSNRSNWNEAEKRTIESVSEGGRLLRLTQTLTYPHQGAVKTYQRGSKTWVADLRPEVGLLTHNIKIQGGAAGAATGYGGHTMIMNNGRAYVENIELYNMGQKAILARYPFHWHMLGAVGAGQYLKNSSIHQSFNRAITIHGTERTLVENNFCYDHIGHGVFLEDGSERFNVIRKNVVLLTKRPAQGEELTPSDNQFDQVQNRTPSSFWITNPQNTFEDNIAAGTHGTGYWFAFPQRPTGLSATDPRFSSMRPHTLPLISFARNAAHSCMSGFDIFDQLDANHAIVTNAGWANNEDHLMENCLWYANNLALYTGIGAGGRSDNLIFDNNIFVENVVATMFASYSIVRQSVFVAHSGFNLIGANRQRYAYRVYDGAGQVHNSHFIGWNHAKANLLINTGAATKHPNHIFTGNTTDHSGFVRCALPNFNVKPVGVAGANHVLHPRFWSVVIKDVTGSITQKANTTLVSNHPFLLVGDEYQPSNWENAYRSDHHFALSVVSYPGLAVSNFPNISVTREKAGTESKHAYYVLGGNNGFKETQKLPMIVNEGFEYVYNFETLPTNRFVRFQVDDAVVGDDFVARFRHFGRLSGLQFGSPQPFNAYGSLSALRNATSSGYYVQGGGDVYLKIVAVSKNQYYDIRWSGNTTLPAIDTDGDQMSNQQEHALGRHMYDASDLATHFNQSNNFEGWVGIYNVSNPRVQSGYLSGTSSNNGDAIIFNNDFNFRSDRVRTLQVRMKASQNTTVQVFFGTSIAPGHSGSRVVSAFYSGNGNWQTLTFDMANHVSWNNTITTLRLDPVSGLNISFDVDWIKGFCSGCPNGGASAARATDYIGNLPFNKPQPSKVYPNPVQDKLYIKGASRGTTVQVLSEVGQLLKTQSYQDALDLSDLMPGVYLIKCQGKTYKVIKE